MSVFMIKLLIPIINFLENIHIMSPVLLVCMFLQVEWMF